MVNWEQLVAERNAWVAHNFPDDARVDEGGTQPAKKRFNSLLGCIEEVGELAHADLKADQAIRGTAEEHEAAAKDAIGDFSVYLMGVMSRYNVLPTHVIPPRDWHGEGPQVIGALATVVGHISDAFYREQRAGALSEYSLFMWAHRVSRGVHLCDVYCGIRGWHYPDIVQNTWDQVKQRDWIKYPFDGLTK